MSTARALSVLTGFFALTVPLMPVQALCIAFSTRAARWLPHWYHRQVCRLMGVRLHVDGGVVQGQPVLLVANHVSWLDIPVLSAVAPVSFVAKSDVGRWPFVSALAKLQRTVFVDRERRAAVGETTTEMAERLREGDAIVLFAEGTSSDGGRVLPFKTSLFAVAKPPARAGGSDGAGAADVVVQTVAVVYTRLHGVPLGRADRPKIGWFGDMEMQSHAWQLLQAGPVDVAIRISAPIPLESFADRKDLARRTETLVREQVHRMLRGRPDDEPLAIVEPSADMRRPTAKADAPDGGRGFR